LSSLRERVSAALQALRGRGAGEQRGISQSLGHPSSEDPTLIKMFGGAPSHAGVNFDELGALSWTALSAGLRLSSETMGSVPWGVLEHLGDNGRKVRDDHPVNWLLHDEPNPEQTPMEFFEQQQASSLLWPGSYAQIVYNGAGKPIELWPLNPDRVTPFRDPKDELWWRVVLPGASGHVNLPAREVLAVRGFSPHGLIGSRLVEQHRDAIGLGLATEIYSASFFGQGANISGFLTHPGKLSDIARTNLEKSVSKRVEGLTNTHRIRLLEEGLQWQATSIAPEKAQLILGRQFQIAEASRILRIPPHLLYALENAHFANIEQQSLEFIRDHVRPWTVRREQRINKQLFTPAERRKLFVKANLEALARGDMKTRFEAYAIGINNRFLTPNQVRAYEDLNPGPAELDEYQVTPNMNAPSAVNGDQGGTNGQDPGAS
jgi:HK97 family phage portal protein